MTHSVRRAAFGLAAAALAAGLAAAPALAQDGRFSIGLWGDMPYAKAGDQPFIPALIADMNASDIAFSIYDGDIKDGSSRCTDTVYSDAVKMFDSLAKPLIYVVGDNEWTDCHRGNNGGYNNLERLSYLRKTMFTRTGSFGAEKMPLEHQGKPGEAYAENTRIEPRRRDVRRAEPARLEQQQGQQRQGLHQEEVEPARPPTAKPTMPSGRPATPPISTG